MAKETYSYGKRDLFIWQKRPIHMAKETYSYGKRDLGGGVVSLFFSLSFSLSLALALSLSLSISLSRSLSRARAHSLSLSQYVAFSLALHGHIIENGKRFQRPLGRRGKTTWPHTPGASRA